MEDNLKSLFGFSVKTPRSEKISKWKIWAGIRKHLVCGPSRGGLTLKRLENRESGKLIAANQSNLATNFIHPDFGHQQTNVFTKVIIER